MKHSMVIETKKLERYTVEANSESEADERILELAAAFPYGDPLTSLESVEFLGQTTRFLTEQEYLNGVGILEIENKNLIEKVANLIRIIKSLEYSLDDIKYTATKAQTIISKQVELK